MRTEKSVMIIAGDASADLYGAQLVVNMRRLAPGIRFFGVGGPEMEGAGVTIMYQLSALAVVGLTEVVPKIGYISRALRGLTVTLTSGRPDLIVLIDYPGFNLYLARRAHALGIPVLYYIPPQVWAWWTSRVRTIAKRVDRVAVILPFEREFYQRFGLPAEYVGHPLMDVPLPQSDEKRIREGLGIGQEKRPILGLLPGSRAEEVQRMMPEMIGAAEIIARSHPLVHCVLPLASSVGEDVVRPYLEHTEVAVTISRSNTRELLKIADVALIASGTATLEAAIMETPMVIAYRVSPLSYILGRSLAKVPHIGLVNLIAGRTIVPELIQGKATACRLAEEASTILKNDGLMTEMKDHLRWVRDQLGRGGASKKAACIAAEMMGL